MTQNGSDAAGNSVTPPVAAPRGPKLSASRLGRWAGRRVSEALSARAGSYVFLSPPFEARQSVRNRRTGYVHRYRVRDKNDLSVARQIFEGEDYSVDRLMRGKDIRARYQAILASGKTPLIVDCGGNIGLSAKYFAEQFPQARIIVVEPGDDNFAVLSENCTEANITPLHAAIAGSERKGRVVDAGHGSCGLRVEEDPAGGLAFLTVPGIIAQHGGADAVPFLLKVDIEGFEADLFAADTSWLDQFYLLAVELHDWMIPGEARSGPFLRAIAPLNRDFVHIGENIFSIANRDPAA